MDLVLGTSPGHGAVLSPLFLVGLAVFFGTAGGKLIQFLRIPKIIGYIVIGVILGPVLGLVSAETVENFGVFNVFALGIIGFLIGGELEKDIFVKFGRQVTAILLFEGAAAFSLVLGLSFLTLSFFYEWQMALGVSLVFGAICAATDPASTTNVLWEYKCRGPLTTMLTAIVALDDALALVLYMLGVTLAGIVTGNSEGGLLGMAWHFVYEVGGSLGLGVIAGVLLSQIVKRTDDDEITLVFVIGVIALTIGLASSVGLDVILSAMACGVMLVNLEPRISHRSFDVIRKFSPPVYVLFFVIIGARLDVTMSAKVWLLAGAYVVGSVIGKTSGAYAGARYSKAVPTVRKYLGFCLYQQGTIAIALLIMASHRFEGEVREMMLSVIILGVFILQFIGPLCVKLGVKKAGESGMNITEEDLIKSYTVGDMMDAAAAVISPGMSMREVVTMVSNTNSMYYSVVDDEGKLAGAITFDGIRNTFATNELNDWLVALDIVEPLVGCVVPGAPLGAALEKARQLDIEHLPVVVSEQTNEFAGLLDCRRVQRALSAEVLSRQQKADSMGLAFG